MIAGIERCVHCNVALVDCDAEKFRIKDQFVTQLELLIQLGGSDRVRLQIERGGARLLAQHGKETDVDDACFSHL